MNKFLKLDWILLISVIFLLLFSLLSLFSISFEDNGINLINFKKQLISILIGIFLMIFFAIYDYRSFGYFSTKLYFITIGILILVIIFGKTMRGTTGWIELGSFNIQPVELAKVVMIIFLASFFSKKRSQLSIVMRIIASVILVLIPVYLILKQPDFGSSMVIVACWAVMLFLSGITRKNLLILAAIGLLVAFSSWMFLKDYQKDRLVNFVNPYDDPRGSGYNVIQSMIAVGSGGVFGKGLGHGSQSQLNFLPEKHTDFIFAVIAEELGFLGSMLVFAIFATMIYRIKEIGRMASDNFGYLFCSGAVAVIFFQLFVNIGMNIGIMPVAGVPLPFLSYGGSSMIAMLSVIGIVESIYLHRIKSLD